MKVAKYSSDTLKYQENGQTNRFGRSGQHGPPVRLPVVMDLGILEVCVARNNMRLSVRRRRCLSKTCIGFDQVSRDCNLNSCSVPTRPPLNCGNIPEVGTTNFSVNLTLRAVVLVNALHHFRVKVSVSAGMWLPMTTVALACQNLKVSR